MISDIEIFSIGLLDEQMHAIDLWTIPNQKDLEILIRIEVMFSESNIVEVFDSAIITGVCRNKYISGEFKIPYGGRVFLFDEFLENETMNSIRETIRSCSRINIDETISELRKIVYWDFEDME